MHTSVFDYNVLPTKRVLSIRSVLATDTRMNIGAVIHHAKQDMRMKLADTLANDEDIVGMASSPGYLTLTAEVVCLTRKELEALMLEQFKKGVNYSQGMMPSFRV